ncbi:F0F1 ATP synthase subunit A [Fimbriimonas ginsengisoli]|uniref:ATP synthase subunit a n=1 Tax=Fimbriimonas ginsengisoli Gsoil 348 TaxID=661478 RepID=A0A068NZ81_FIMGI|nr:F0F1 ATP synthase subunit A [Fimbriimonas ginsengisoli]AIE88114.1 F0F1 ATP synthase subunit A [Fimbriimonas ginsengisoli Gsoil 348]
MLDFLHIGTSLLAAEEIQNEAPNHDLVRLWFYIILMLVIMFAVLANAKSGLKERVFRNPLTACAEQLFLFIENMCIGTIGSHGRKYLPMMMTFWLVIFIGNLMALLLPFSPTSSLSFNLGMALISIGYVQYEGIKANGFGRHISHFTGPKLTGAMVIVSAMIFVIEIISELMKNLSLSLRLYGNIHGGHVAVESMNKLGGGYIPFGEFLLPIKLLTCLVQALIFTLLTCVYLSLVTHHEEDHGPQADNAAHAH